MFKRISIVVGAIAVLAASAAVWSPGASAHGDRGDGIRWGEYWITPGVFEAEGSGVAAAAGKLELKLCAEDGILLVKRGDSEIAVDAYDEKVEWLGLEVYFGVSGCAEISGWGVAALIVGDGLSMRAAGIGIAYLQGEGTWGRDNGDSGEWLAEGKVYKIGTKSAWSTPTPKPTKTPTEVPDEPDATPTPGVEEPDPTATPGDEI